MSKLDENLYLATEPTGYLKNRRSFVSKQLLNSDGEAIKPADDAAGNKRYDKALSKICAAGMVDQGRQGARKREQEASHKARSKTVVKSL